MFTTRHRGEAGQPFTDERVTALLDAASAPTEAGPAPGEAAALAAFRAAHRAGAIQSSPRLHSPATSLRTTAAAVLGAGALLTGGVAAAQAGMLPGAAQDIAHDMLYKLGVSVPGAGEHSTGHVDRGGAPTGAPGKSGSAGSPDGAGPEGAEKDSGGGSGISDLARDPRYRAVDRGSKVSGTASGEKSQAGQHGQAEAPDRPRGDGTADGPARVTTPNTGGSDRPEHADAHAGNKGSRAGGGAAGQGRAPVTLPNHGTAADGANDGASAPGRKTAAEASDGRSSAGADNRRATRPDTSPPDRPDTITGRSPGSRP